MGRISLTEAEGQQMLVCLVNDGSFPLRKLREA